MIEWITGIGGILFGSGITGFVQFVIKRKDEENNSNRQLLSPILDELCNICAVTFSLINFVEEQNTEIAKVLSDERKLYKEANRKLSSADKWQDEIMTIHQKDLPSDADICNLKVLRKLITDKQQEYSELISQALNKPDEAKALCQNAISKIEESLIPFLLMHEKETTHYKLSNKKIVRKITKIFKDIDKLIRCNKELTHSCSYLQIPNILLLELYKVSNDGRLFISNNI